MIEKELLVDGFARNLRVIKMQSEGLTHADSLLQLPFRGNCLNWVLGHLAGSRDSVLDVLGEEPLLTEEEKSRYGYGSAPVTQDGEDIVPMERLLDVLEKGQEKIAAGLARLKPDDYRREVGQGERKTTLDHRLFFLYFHDAYHTGQTEILRQLAGTDDGII
ncbi:MAG: DinB family protein [Anaerolineae bacterium]|nr:DinB family protein [Anaerolineae bacterium]